MILESLGKIRGSGIGNTRGNGSARNGDARPGREEVRNGDESVASSKEADLEYQGSYDRSSVRSSNTMVSSFSPIATSSVRSSPRSVKRYSNNLFGSGRMRDYNYNRSPRGGGSQRIVSTESGLSIKGYSDRPITPDGDASVSSSSAQSSPMNDKTPVLRSAPLNPPGPYKTSAADYRLSKTLNPAALKRASLALEEALKEIEEEIGEEAEDEIVMPRSAPASRSRFSQQSRFSGDSAEVCFCQLLLYGVYMYICRHRLTCSSGRIATKREPLYRLTSIMQMQKHNVPHLSLCTVGVRRHYLPLLGCQDTYLACLGP
jgi:serine/arginine repetitive matrix protein 2